MNNILVIAKRELAGLFYSPIAYVVLFMFLMFSGILFGLVVFVPGAFADMREFFRFARVGLFFVVALLTMSVFSDEYRSGRMEMLRTSPITEAQLLLGKFLGTYLFYCVLVISTLIFVALLMIYGRPDYGALRANYLGILLLGAMFVSIGLFFSACTQNQIVAALSTFLVLGLLTFIGDLAFFFPPAWRFLGLNIPVRPVAQYLGVGTHMADFSKGIFDTAHVSYFLCGSFLFLFLTYLLLESRKWR